MKIIIVGLGKAGRTLAIDLCKEGHDVTVIETERERLERITNHYDVMGVHGNGASHSVQEEAGVSTADMLISTTQSDELNLLCCLTAQRAGHCKTIARVRNPEYNTEIEFIREKLGLYGIVNPELASARNMARTLRFPSTIEAETFARGRIEILKFRVKENSVLDGIRLADFSGKVDGDVLICAVERGDEVIIPNGDTVIYAKDIISFVADIREINKFYEQVGIREKPVKNVMIAGGSPVTFYLTRMLEAFGMHVKIIEKNMDRCEMLSEQLPKATIVHGDASDKSLLQEEGIEQYDAFAAMTDLDEENILISLYAKKLGGHKRIFTKVDRIAFDDVIRELELDSIVHPNDITAELIIRLVRSLENENISESSNIETLHRLINGKVEALEFIIREETKTTGILLQELPIRKGILVAAICRNGKVIIPGGSDSIQIGDNVIIVTREEGLDQIDDILS